MLLYPDTSIILLYSCEKHPWVGHLTCSPKEEVVHSQSVPTFTYERGPMFGFALLHCQLTPVTSSQQCTAMVCCYIDCVVCELHQLYLARFLLVDYSPQKLQYIYLAVIMKVLVSTHSLTCWSSIRDVQINWGFVRYN